MSEHTKTSLQVGPGLLGCLTIVFVIAKLTGHLDWSWWWVFSPLWVPWAALAAFFALIGVCLGFVSVINAIDERMNRRFKRMGNDE